MSLKRRTTISLLLSLLIVASIILTAFGGGD